MNYPLPLLSTAPSAEPFQFPTVATDGLLSGNLGKVVYNLTLAKPTQNAQLYKEGLDLLLSIVDRIGQADGLRDFSLGAGLTGLGLVIDHLEKHQLIVDYTFEDLLKEIDANVASNAMSQFGWHHTDFLYGAGGQLYYLAQRVHRRPEVEELLLPLINKLDEYKITDAYGVRFWNAPYFRMSEIDRHDSINFSLSHGLSGFLLVLLHVHQNCPALDLRSTIEGGIQFILNYCSASASEETENLFPASVNLRIPDKEYTHRLAWCYGDGNILLLLYKAAHVLGEERYSKKADEIGEKTVHRKSSKTTANTDAHFCHGTTGTACLYKTLFELSGQPMYDKAYRYWLSVSYCYFSEDTSSNSFSENVTSLLDGNLGAQLVLNTLGKGKDATWKHLLLL